MISSHSESCFVAVAGATAASCWGPPEGCRGVPGVGPEVGPGCCFGVTVAACLGARLLWPSAGIGILLEGELVGVHQLYCMALGITAHKLLYCWALDTVAHRAHDIHHPPKEGKLLT